MSTDSPKSYGDMRATYESYGEVKSADASDESDTPEPTYGDLRGES